MIVQSRIARLVQTLTGDNLIPLEISKKVLFLIVVLVLSSFIPFPTFFVRP